MLWASKINGFESVARMTFYKRRKAATIKTRAFSKKSGSILQVVENWGQSVEGKRESGCLRALDELLNREERETLKLLLLLGWPLTLAALASLAL